MAKRTLTVAAMCLVLGMAALVSAQQDNNNNNGDRGGRNGRSRGGGGWDPAQMRQQYMDDLKTQLGAKDDEWQVLQPKLEKVRPGWLPPNAASSVGIGSDPCCAIQ